MADAFGYGPESSRSSGSPPWSPLSSRSLIDELIRAGYAALATA